MEHNLKSAIIHFIANEFKLEPRSIAGMDLNFLIDLNLDREELTALLQRLQDALNFTLPEDANMSIETLEDLLRAVDPDMEKDE